jgi:PmbA protein
VNGLAMEDLLKVAEIACEAAVRAGADFADASCERGRGLSVSVEKNATKSSDALLWASISVRAFSEGGTGWSSLSGISEEAARQAGRQAAELAKASEPDPDFSDLVHPADYPEVDGIYDPAIAEATAAEVAGWVTCNIDAARSVAADAVVSGEAYASWREWALVNNLGVRAAHRSTSAWVNSEVVIRRNDDVGSFYEWDAARRASDLAPEGLGATAAREALRYLHSRSMTTKTMPVVFGPLAARAFFDGLCAAASAEEVQRRRSFLVGKQGEQIASPLVTLIDDPLLPGGLSSGVCDGDGFPHRRLALVENGVLKTYLHSNYTARKAGVENTGHSTRGGIAPTNVIPALGAKTAAEIVAEVEDGVYVTLGRPSPDAATGQVSALVDAGFRIENGELTYPLKSTMVAGYGLELLSSIDAISSDYRAEPGRVLPTIRVQGVRVASGD